MRLQRFHKGQGKSTMAIHLLMARNKSKFIFRRMIIKTPKMNEEKKIFSYVFEVKRYSLIGEFWSKFKGKKK